MRDRLTHILVVGLVLTFFGGFYTYDAAKVGWPRVQATIISLDPQCEMQSSDGAIRNKTITIATVDCAQIEQFLAQHPERSWTANHELLAHVSLDSPKSMTTTLVMYPARSPKVGDQFVMVQDPNNPARLYRDIGGNGGVVSAEVLAALGALLLATYGWLRWQRPRSTSTVAPSRIVLATRGGPFRPPTAFGRRE